jgi:hypothetical protein
MKKVMTIASMAALLTLGLAVPSPAFADAYDDCVNVCLQNYVYNNYDIERYEFCRASCERKYPPNFAPPSMDAKID